jgi:uncharacterized protein YozE (UPF0346 family)
MENVRSPKSSKIITQLADYVWQSLSLQTTNPSQEIVHRVLNTKVPYQVQMIPSLVRVLKEINPVFALYTLLL